MIVFFFFQAEDGIRDLTVTGVQTCALPISIPGLERWTPYRSGSDGSASRRMEIPVRAREVISETMEKLLLLEIVFMACAVTTRLPKVSAFFRCTVKLCATFALIIKDPTAVAICTYFETS